MPHLSLAAISLTDVEITRLFVSIAALMGMAHLLGSLFARLHMPRVIGEVAGGLLLGPTVLGAISKSAYNWTFNSPDFPTQGKLLAMASELGLVLLMFMSGMEIKARFAREDRKVAFPLLAGATVLPFLIGLAAPKVFDFTRPDDHHRHRRRHHVDPGDLQDLPRPRDHAHPLRPDLPDGGDRGGHRALGPAGGGHLAVEVGPPVDVHPRQDAAHHAGLLL